jgi:hypothetical protein
MDKTLQDRWQTNRAPFDGKTVHPPDLLRIEELREFLIPVVRALKAVSGDNKILKLADWHEHDGYVTSPEATTWSEVEAWVASTASLYEARNTDAYVRVGIYPESLDWYFRLYVMDKDEDAELYPGIWGNFDLSAQEQLFDKIKWPVTTKLERTNSVDFFKKNHAL